MISRPTRAATPSLSLRPRPGYAAVAVDRARTPGAGDDAGPRWRPARLPTAARSAAGGTVDQVSLRFLDRDLERQYQHLRGLEGQAGFRIITSTAALVWALASLIVPAGTAIPVDVATVVCSAMAAMNGVAYLLTGRARTLDRQHLIASVLTALNGLVIFWLASTGGVLPGYGVSAVMLLFAFGFVSRTGFIYAVGRSAVVLVGFAVTALAYRGPGDLLIDAFLLVAAVIASLVALRLLERSRRRVFYQDVVINEQSHALRVEKERSEKLLLDVLPARIAARLLNGERTIAEQHPSVTVLFADIVGFTSLSARLRPDQLIDLLDRLFTGFDELVAERGLEKIKTIGDAYMVAGGLSEPLDDHAVRMVDLGLRMIDVAGRAGTSVGGLPLRIGVHSGPVVGGVIGHRKFAFDIWGDTVNIASRLESHGAPNRVHVTEATRRLVEEHFEAEPLGPVDLRGHGPIDTFAIVGPRRAPVAHARRPSDVRSRDGDDAPRDRAVAGGRRANGQATALT